MSSYDLIKSGWKPVHGILSTGIGVFLLYATWANPPIAKAATPCEPGTDTGVHFTEGWIIDYWNNCGGLYDNSLVYFVVFTIFGIVLVIGGVSLVKAELSNEL